MERQEAARRAPQLRDPSQDFIDYRPLPLDSLFCPRSVAIVGAKDTVGSVGRTIMANLMHPGFSGKLFPVNPKRKEVMGHLCYRSLSEVAEPIDLLIVVTPAATVPQIIREGVEAGIPAAIVISAGFKEMGEAGAQLEAELVSEAKKGGMRLIGPNCLGLMNPLYGLNATFAKGMALPGNVAFISQSGAMCTAVLDWSLQEKVGFSAFVSIGSMADVDWGDLISYLGAQPTTHSLLLYMETVGDARAFLSAAREIALEKPIIVIKGGKSLEAASAAASHTGSLTGSDQVFDAALERVGVLRVDAIADLFGMASLLARQPVPTGPRLAILTNAGGPAVLATDAAALGGATLLPPSAMAMEKLNCLLPEAWSHSNPIDILGDALPERFSQALEILMEDEANDGLLVILSPQEVTDPVGTADALRPWGNRKGDKPLLASWMGGASVQKGIELLTQASIPTFIYPDQAARSFAKMWEYSRNLQSLYQVPPLRDSLVTDEERQKAKEIIDRARQAGRCLLTEFESKEVLSLYGIPCVQTKVAHELYEAVALAEEMGYPVVAKLFSSTITHKSDVGGVKLNLQSPEEVKAAFDAIRDSVSEKVAPSHFEGVTIQKMVASRGYELILGSSSDPQFGPVLLFGAGGELVEVFGDSAIALPPLNGHLARRLMAKTKIYKALQGVRGRKAVDLAALERLLVHFSQLIVENRWIKECDINPLLANDEELIALDGRILLYSGEQEMATAGPPVAIRPYPIEYMSEGSLSDGRRVAIRPLQPEDTPAVVAFHEELSEDTVRQRYFAFLSLDERVAHERLVRICFNDYDREIALLAEETTREATSTRPILGIIRLRRSLAKREQAELKMIIVDRCHRKGLGSLLMQRALDVARREKISSIEATVLAENEGMIHLCQKFGFVRLPSADPLMEQLVWNG